MVSAPQCDAGIMVFLFFESAEDARKPVLQAMIKGPRRSVTLGLPSQSGHTPRFCVDAQCVDASFLWQLCFELLRFVPDVSSRAMTVLLCFLVCVAASDYLIVDSGNDRVQRCSSSSPNLECETVAGTGAVDISLGMQRLPKFSEED